MVGRGERSKTYSSHWENPEGDFMFIHNLAEPANQMSDFLLLAGTPSAQCGNAVSC